MARISRRRFAWLSGAAAIAATKGCGFSEASPQGRRAAVIVPAALGELTPPRVGETYVDPAFGTSITRLTDDAATLRTGGLHPEYAQISAFNRDDSLLILRGQDGGAYLLNGNGRMLGQIKTSGHIMYEPRWSRLDPHGLYYNTGPGATIRRLNVNSGENIEVADYSTEFETISFGSGQSDVSDNERINVTADDRYIFVVDLLTGRRQTILDTGEAPIHGSGFDSVTLAMDGESFAVSFDVPGTGRGEGFEQFDSDGHFITQLMHSGGHLAMARDAVGTPVMVVSNSNSSPQQPPAPNDDWNGIVKISLDGTATRTLLLGLIEAADNCCASLLFAGRSGDGWVYVGTYKPSQPTASEWQGYDQELFRIRLDPRDGHRDARVERLAHHRSTTARYLATPLLSVSMSGRRLVFPSDFGDPNAPVDTYMIELETSSASIPGAPRSRVF